MAKGSDVFWVSPPQKMVGQVDEYGDRVWAAAHAVAQFIGAKMQDVARTDAPWQDRTGNARSSLFGAVEREAEKVVTIYLSHGFTIEYGKYLELSNGGRFGIVMKTIEQHLPELKRMLDSIFR